MEDLYLGAHCGSYTVELTPALPFVTVGASGAPGPDGQPFYDTLSIDQTMLTQKDVGDHEIQMRVF